VAKPLPIDGLDPDRRLRPNARRILATRIGEVWAYGPAVTHPGRVRELHDMRIACKRLRYLLEIFHVAFPTDLEPFIGEVKGLQDVLGDIHDRDVQIPMLHEHLARLSARDALAARGLLRDTRTMPAPVRAEVEFDRFRAQLLQAGTSAERPGIQALLDMRMRERDELYERFLADWRRLGSTGFRRRLERALGL